MAAIAAAQGGRRVLLVERMGCLGGMATSGLVQPITMWGIGKHYIIGGQGRRILESLESRGPGASTGMSTYGPTCDAEHLKFVLEQQGQAAGAELLYYASVREAQVSQGLITSVCASVRGRELRLSAAAYVDATGDAELAALAGAPCDVGTQGVTLMFVIGGIDRARAGDREAVAAAYAPHKVNYRGALVFWHPGEGRAYANMTEVENFDPLNPADVTRATIECRRQAWDMIQVFRAHVPGFENAYIEQTAPLLGVRESRRIRGLYTLTTDDVLAGRDFPDTIARGSSPLDVHGSDAGGKKKYQPLSRSYGVPYRCLLPTGVRNLLVAGRPVSTDHGAHSSLRRMAPGFALGEAAGVAAALCTCGDAQAVDVGVLQTLLRQRGAVLDPEP
jgi:hypothetical protein